MIKMFKWQFAFSSGASQFVIKVSIFFSFFLFLYYEKVCVSLTHFY